jgi:signal transduction histidine kinase
MPRSEAFMLVVDTSLMLISGFVALLLLMQLFAARASATLPLACGFLLVALTTLPQLLRATKGAFVDLRLCFITDLTLPGAAMVYVRFRSARHVWTSDGPRVGAAAAAGIAMVVGIAALATWLTAASSSADSSNQGDADSWFAFATVLVVGADVVAIALLWRRLHSVLELWLLVALTAWLIGALMQGVASDGTSFVWHVAHLYGLLGAVAMMMALLADNAILQARFTGPGAARQRLRNRLGNRIFSKGPALESEALDVIADELRQPLCAIAVNADAITRLLDNRPQDLDEVRAALADISSDASRASNSLHTAQRLLADAREPAANIDIAQLVDECVSQLSTELARHSVTCEVEIAAQLPGVRGFRRQLQHLLINLVGHALEAMSGLQQRDRRLRVRTDRHDARAVAIWIEDSGSGLRSWSGLAVCRSIVHAHGGHISVTPRNDGGAALKVILPASS